MKSKITRDIKKRVGKVKLTDGKKRTESSKKWLTRQLNDPYVQKARMEGYRSRAAYKLLDIQEKFKILKPNQIVVDLGAAPGGWLQVAQRFIKNGTLIGIDLQEIEEIPGAVIHQGDFLEEDTLTWLEEALDGRLADCVISDMAASACGISEVDHLRIMHLIELVFDFCKTNLKQNGTMVAKVLRGGTESKLLSELKRAFKQVQHFKPQSSRQDSAEMFVVARGFRFKHTCE